MNETQMPLNDLIRLAGRDAARSIAADWQREDDADLWFSPAFEAKMDALTRRSGRRYRRLRALRTALIAAAILALLAATAFAVPPVREAIIRTWITWTGRSADFRYSGPATGGDDFAAGYEPKYIPEGYVETERVETESILIIIYSNEADRNLAFTRSIATDSLISIDTEHTKHSSITIHDYSGDLFVSLSKEYQSSILLHIQNHAYVITGYVSDEELIRMMESLF